MHCLENNTAVNYHTSLSLPADLSGVTGDDSNREECALASVPAVDPSSDSWSYSLPLLSSCESVSLLQSCASR